jgi:hypothetical protein
MARPSVLLRNLALGTGPADPSAQSCSSCAIADAATATAVDWSQSVSVEICLASRQSNRLGRWLQDRWELFVRCAEKLGGVNLGCDTKLWKRSGQVFISTSRGPKPCVAQPMCLILLVNQLVTENKERHCARRTEDLVMN